MAFPNARVSDFINGTVVSPTFLNTLQDGVVGLCSVTKTFSGLVITGTGGATTAGNAGQIKVVSPSAGVTTPQALYQDANGFTNTLIDHNGFTLTPGLVYNEDWIVPFTSNPAWYFYTVGGGSTTLHLGATAGLPFNHLAISHVGSTIDSGAVITSQAYQAWNASYVTRVSEWWVQVDSSALTSGNTNMRIKIGYELDSTFGVGNTSCGFQIDAASTWSVIGLSTVVSSVAISSSSPQRFRLEQYGSATPIGVASWGSVAANTGKARFFINDNLAGVVGSSNAAWRFVAGALTTTGATGSGRFDLGPLRFRCNYYSSTAVI